MNLKYTVSHITGGMSGNVFYTRYLLTVTLTAWRIISLLTRFRSLENYQYSSSIAFHLAYKSLNGTQTPTTLKNLEEVLMYEESDEKLEEKKKLRKHRVQYCSSSGGEIIYRNHNANICDNHMTNCFSLSKQKESK